MSGRSHAGSLSVYTSSKPGAWQMEIYEFKPLKTKPQAKESRRIGVHVLLHVQQRVMFLGV
jgi:hypothetical protein